MAGLTNCDGPGSGKTVFGRLSWEGQSGAGLICDEGEDEEERDGGVERITKRKRRKKAARQRKRHTGSDRGLVDMGCTGIHR